MLTSLFAFYEFCIQKHLIRFRFACGLSAGFTGITSTELLFFHMWFFNHVHKQIQCHGKYCLHDCHIIVVTTPVLHLSWNQDWSPTITCSISRKLLSELLEPSHFIPDPSFKLLCLLSLVYSVFLLLLLLAQREKSWIEKMVMSDFK